ncbi:uncharacterized protein LOC116257954 isoform X2 [Nymphaea colorata]|uniref:uncharacterized protein LOC116257954 isoform X2 n=1 Tax=Nymphaea colorata TaxID=210225 RepID=UPI00129E0C62|nr:uncharacterized protein LOC116257954 isoform X2 [Nymphaea colorata]
MDNFEKAVEAGLALTKRLYYGRDDRAAEMTAGQSKAELGGRKYFPTAPTVYAVISDPAIVDNPDQPSYQPHLHGRWDPPALIPMQMNRVELEVNCVLSSAVVEFRGSFRVHCVATNRKCDCRVVVPRSEKTSILGAEVDISGRSYSTELAPIEEAKSYMERVPKDEDMKFIQHQIFSFTIPQVSSDDVFGGLLVQPPHPDDFDKRNIFCLYILPASNLHAKVFRREVIFLIDTSASIQGLPLEESKNAVSAALMNLRPTDSFSIMSFNEEIFSFSSSLVPATEEKIEEAHQWLSETCHATGGTSILLPLNEAMKMFSKSLSSVPQIFLITDGSVKDEKNICHVVQNHIRSMGLNSPRISTFGIGLYCNHYFLRLLAQIGRGHYDAAYKTGTITLQMKRFFNATSSPLLTNVSIDTLGHLDSLEVSTTLLPDVSVGCPLIIMGRCNESFPNSHKVTGSLADGRELVINLKAQKTKGLLIDKVMAKQQIDILTASAWFSGSNELVDQVTTISMQSSIPCEFTQMTLLQASEKKTSVTQGKEVHFPKSKHVKPCLVHGLHVGFGNVMATDKNILILSDEAHGSTDSGKGVNCCNMSVFGDCTCTCCGPDVGSTFAHSWNDCTIAVTQYCAAFACLGCFSLCSNLCGN